jgi:hypothetical protein
MYVEPGTLTPGIGPESCTIRGLVAQESLSAGTTFLRAHVSMYLGVFPMRG